MIGHWVATFAPVIGVLMVCAVALAVKLAGRRR
jgi:hypothetical protein